MFKQRRKTKYKDLAWEYRKIEDLTKAVQIVLIVIGTVTKDFLRYCECLPKFERHLLRTMQTAAILGTA